MSYRKTLEALKAYAPKQLIVGAYKLKGDGLYCCAVGAAVSVAIVDIEAEGFRENWGTAHFAEERLGLSMLERHTVQNTNDDFNGTVEARYDHVLAFLEGEVAKEAP